MGMFIPPGSPSSGTPGGSSGQLQYNNAGAFNGVPGSSVDPATGDTTFSARWISTRNSAAGAPAHTLTGTWFTGGTAESTKPHFLIEPTGSLSNNWNVNGTGFAVNAPSGFPGILAWFGVNGSNRVVITNTGQINASAIQVGANNAITGTSNNILVFPSAAAGIDSNGGVESFSIRERAFYGWVSGSSAGSSASCDLRLYRDAANTLSQRNGGTSATPVPQTYRIANYQASNTDFERGYLNWASNVLLVGTEKGTTGGTARAMELQTDGVTRIRIGAAGQIGVFGAAAVAQPAAIPDATDAASTQSGLNSVLAALRSLGWIAT